MTDEARKIRVMVVSKSIGEAMFLRLQIDRMLDMECIGISLSYYDATQQITELSPDVLVVRFRPEVVEFIHKVQQSHPQIRIVVTGQCSHVSKELNLESLLLLEIPLSPERFFGAIRDAYHGKVGCAG